jgi:hypothetical protein
MGDQHALQCQIVKLTRGRNFYYLRSSKMNLGNLKCWIDDDKSKMEIMEGSW